MVLLTGLGDVVNGLPVANALKAQDPSRRITWVAEPAPSQPLLHHPSVDEVIVFEKSRGARGVADLRRRMRGRSFDVTFNMMYYFKSVWPTVFSGAPRRIGFGRGRARDGVWLFSNERLPHRGWRHQQDLFLEFLDYLGLGGRPVEWKLTLTADERRAQAGLFGALDGRPVAAIVVASGKPVKDWPAERWAAVADALERDHGFQVMLLGGPSAREAAIASGIEARAEARVVRGLSRTVRELMWRVEGSQLVLAPDTGPLHLAHAFGVPVIGLYAHSNPWRVGPWGRYRDLIVDRFRDPGEPPDPSLFAARNRSMELITVEDVLEKVALARERYLGRKPPPPTPVGP
jgi:heptosyltransferase I